MSFDIIVFTQEELLNAAGAGIKFICLCDNAFVLPSISGVHYTAIGNVSVSANMTKEELSALDIVYSGFSPELLPSKYTKKIDTKTNVLNTKSASSYISSYLLSSYFMTSYRYQTSYNTSYTTSYVTSYTTAYLTSYVTSYTTSYLSSYVTSYVTSYTTSYKAILLCNTPLPQPEYQTEEHHGGECIMVNGYGINLI